MPVINLKNILQPASQHGFAVGSFNAINFDFMRAILLAAQVKSSPVIISLAEVHFKYFDLETMCQVFRIHADKFQIPVCLNLDHGTRWESVVQATQLGFTSVMFDGSQLSFEENINMTKRVVELCHTLDISVEAELGAVGGDEQGGITSEANPEMFTDPELAKEFVERTGIDALAVAIGNTHGKYKGLPNLDFDRLSLIRFATGVPLVLHGGSGLSLHDFKKLVSFGIRKVNYYTGMSQIALDTVNEQKEKAGKSYNGYPDLLWDIKKNVQHHVEHQLAILNSVEKAKHY